MVLKTEKVLGYILLSVGLICIFIAFRSMQDIFNKETSPPEIFQMKSLSFSVSAGADAASTAVKINLDSEVRKAVNIFLYYLFMIFVVIVGGKLSSLGIQMVKEVKPSGGGVI